MANDILIDEFNRIKEIVHEVVDGLDEDQLKFRMGGGANSIAWLVWHLTRIQDDHIADVAGREQVWTRGDWYGQFGLPFDKAATGYDQTSEEVGQVHVAGELLLGYYDAVHDTTLAYIGPLTEKDYKRVVDTAWDPPVTLAVRLVSVIADDLQHAGQAAYVRGLLP